MIPAPTVVHLQRALGKFSDQPARVKSRLILCNSQRRCSPETVFGL
jgi:hypothetical protein